MNNEYTIIRQVLDASSAELDIMEYFATIRTDEQEVARQICLSLNYTEADYGDPLTSYMLMDSEGNQIVPVHDTSHLN